MIEVSHEGKRVHILFLMLNNTKEAFTEAKRHYGRMKVYVQVKNSTRRYLVPFNELEFEHYEKQNLVLPE